MVVGYQHTLEAGERPPKSDEEDKWQNYVLTYTRHFTRKGEFRYSSLQIRSQPLKVSLCWSSYGPCAQAFPQNILKTVIPDYPGVSFATDSVNLTLPSEVLLHCRQDLHDALAKGEVGDEDGRKHLKFLLDFYEEEEAALIKEYLNLVGQGLTTYPM
jgi:hypothetical protein